MFIQLLFVGFLSPNTAHMNAW